METQKIILGTRGSKLALVQSHTVKKQLLSTFASTSGRPEIEITDIKTIGDLKQGTPSASKGDKKDWIYELELGLLSEKFDLVVHSAKDIPSDIEPGTEVLPILEREIPFDLFVGKIVNGKRIKFSELQQGSKVGTASLRRKACLLQLRPDLEIIEHRGNITTRIEKLDSTPELAGIVLAAAGLKRLGLDQLCSDIFSPEQLLPAVNQGMLAVQFLSTRDDIRSLVLKLQNQRVYATWKAERTVVDLVKADCKSSIGIFSTISNGRLELRARVALPDGTKCIDIREIGSQEDPTALGQKVAKLLVDQGALDILKESRAL